MSVILQISNRVTQNIEIGNFFSGRNGAVCLENFSIDYFVVFNKISVIYTFGRKAYASASANKYIIGIAGHRINTCCQRISACGTIVAVVAACACLDAVNTVVMHFGSCQVAIKLIDRALHCANTAYCTYRIAGCGNCASCCIKSCVDCCHQRAKLADVGCIGGGFACGYVADDIAAVVQTCRG